MFVVVLGSCRACEGEFLDGLGRWEFSECSGEVWGSSGGCGGGVSVEKVGLEEWVLNGLRGEFWVEFGVISGSGSAQGKLECWSLRVYRASAVLEWIFWFLISSFSTDFNGQGERDGSWSLVSGHKVRW